MPRKKKEAKPVETLKSISSRPPLHGERNPQKLSWVEFWNQWKGEQLALSLNGKLKQGDLKVARKAWEAL